MENRNVIRFAITVGGFTMLSRVLGMVRDVLTAGVFGTSLAMSSFVVAFRIPNLFRALFGEGALSSAFVPVFMQSRRREGETAAWRLARRVVTLVGAVLLGIVALGIVGMSLWLLRPQVGAEAAAVLPLARIMLPYVFFICMAALAMAVLNSYRLFSVSAFTPALLNITWILAVLFIIPVVRGGPSRQIQALAWTVFAAGAVQLAYQVPSLLRVGWRPGVDTDWHDPRVKQVFLLMGPSALGLAVNQVNVMINSLIALYWVGAWAPSALFYAERLIYFPQGILATALGTVLLPVLSDFAAQRKHDEMRGAIHHGLRTLLFVMTPAAIGLFVLAPAIVQMLFEHGSFDPKSTVLTARALSFYAPGLMVFCLAKVFVPAFYALQDTRTPVKVGLCAVTLNLTLNIVSALTLPEEWKHAGMAFSTVISEGFNGLVLAALLRRRLGAFGLRGILAGLGRALGAAAAMAATAFFAERALTTWLYVHLPHKAAQLIGVPLAIALGAAVYFGLARLFRYPELGFVADALRSRKQKKSGDAASAGQA
ncbi:MAG TPA: murein biosynthesis integral membrane protein MurJ [Kiritimatiellia bacterium]|nr:murein biosynthesis integral membrane protein MurJ [Kiritimatiellia bacterium]